MRSDPRADHGIPNTSSHRGLSSAGRGMVALRLGFGAIWALNLVFILDPANQFFSTFGATASSYAPASIVGAGFPTFVAAHPAVFSALIAGVTVYLAIAFLLGLTTRIACLVGGGFAALLLVSQFNGTFLIPGGTDVGPMPLYLAAYAALLVGQAQRYWSLDEWIAGHGLHSRLPSLVRSAGPH
ncbi:MAG: hypothetical protein L3K18_07155 [Thermoplasmata archaeon]|nr:hypothetical protein [Thermoplasmata archaeon]